MTIRYYLLSGLLLARAALAGGGPQNVLVVVNDASATSQQLGHYYQEQRGIPERNICHIFASTNHSMDVAAFSNDVRNPVLSHIADQGLSNQVDYIVFSRDIPYRIGDGAGRHTNSLTSAMFYGFRDYTFLGGCPLPVNSESDYFQAERNFTHGDTPGRYTYYLSSILAAWTPDEVRVLTDRSVAADGLRPTGTAYYAISSDTSRNVRWPQFERAAGWQQGLGLDRGTRVFKSNGFSGEDDVIGYMIGRYNPLNIDQNGFLPGALADHLTSYGGYLFDPAGGQMSILDWVSAGCAGSYGTVVEPCSFTNKFPDARLHYWYARGFSMGESYWMSLQNPYQGVVVGDPLCAPYALPPEAEMYGLPGMGVVSGVVSVTVSATVQRVGQAVDQLDLFLDDRYYVTLTNIAPQAGNRVEAVVDGTTNRYQVQSSDTLEDLASGLADEINLNVDTVMAEAYSDRVELRQLAVAVPGTDMTYTAGATIHTAGLLTVTAWTPGPTFHPARIPARQSLTLSGVVNSGDQVRTVITRLDGIRVTNTAVASTGQTPFDLMDALRQSINNDPALQGTDACLAHFYSVQTGVGNQVELFLIARTNGWEGANLQVDYTVAGVVGPPYNGTFISNTNVISARGAIFLSQGLPEIAAALDLDTTRLPDGPHTVGAVAYEGSRVHAQGRVTTPFTVSNHNVVCSIVEPAPTRHVLRGSPVTVRVETAVSPGAITSVILFVEGKLLARDAMEPFDFVWDTSNTGAGMVGLQALAFSDTGASAQSPRQDIRVFSDRDADGLHDWWEYAYFAGETNATAGADHDGDGLHNFDEFLTDTDPLDSNSFFLVDHIQHFSSATTELRFVSSTSRLYDVGYHVGALTNAADWQAAGTNRFAGADGTTTWRGPLDAPDTNAVFYRINAYIP